MKVVILCGGQGTRLREETQFRPKVLVEIGGRPILWHIMKIYSSYGFHDFILCLGYKGEMIKHYFLNYEVWHNDLQISLGKQKQVTVLTANHQEPWDVILADTGLNTPTGGRINQIRRYLQGEEVFLVTYGDGVANIDITALLRYHRKLGKIGTVTAVRPVSRFGEIRVEDGLARSFIKGAQVKSGWIDGGFFVFNQRVFDYLTDTAWLSGNVRDTRPESASTLEWLIRDNQLAVYEHEGFWGCMDTPRDLELLNELWRTNPCWRVWNPQRRKAGGAG